MEGMRFNGEIYKSYQYISAATGSLCELMLSSLLWQIIKKFNVCRYKLHEKLVYMVDG